jgi:hypothetical protein
MMPCKFVTGKKHKRKSGKREKYIYLHRRGSGGYKFATKK